MTTYDPEAIASAVLAEALTAAEDLPDLDIISAATARKVPMPDSLPGDDATWDAIYIALDDLIARVREFTGIPTPKEVSE